MKKNKKGFTLIELLAVIVILGLLMAIAIPSITRYITQSRKKTAVSTIGNYMSAVVNEVNDLEYTFTGSNTIYAVPIECVSVERGGKSPFGEWLQANDAYWAYVLVQYDELSSLYTYGFTFKDSAGYGMYPMSEAKIDSKGSQIQTGLNLTRPKDGKATNFIESSKWDGFSVDGNTELVVLEATSENGTGDGENTCTLRQKGSNYEEVNYLETDKTKPDSELPVLMKTTSSSTSAFWGYREQIKNIIFQDNINIPNNISDEHKWDVSSTGNGMVMAYIIPNATDSTYYDLYIQGDKRIYANPDSSSLFYDFKNVDSINNMSVLNTSKVTNMSCMFYNTGYNSSVFTLDLGSNFDTSKVTNMQQMFYNTGRKSPVFKLDLGDKFNTSEVKNMYFMFGYTGNNSSVFTLDLGDKFDTSNVTNMSYMFGFAGYTSTIFTLDLGDKFDTSNVISMADMFRYTGYKSPVFTLNLGDKFDTSNVENMSGMFFNTGYTSTVFELNCSNWSVDNVINVKDFSNSNRVTPPNWVN